MRRFLKFIYVFLIVIFAFGVVGILYSINQKDTASASSKINDAGNPGATAGTGRSVVRTSTGTLYAFINTAGTCGVWKSTDGTTWTEQDSAHHQGCGVTTNRQIAMAIDSTNTIHLVWASAGNDDTVAYITFNTSTDTFVGTFTNITNCANGASFPYVYDLGISIDSSNKPHLIAHCSSDVDGAYYIRYTNRVSGSWKAWILVDLATVNAGVGLTIDKDNKPEIVYYTFKISSSSVYAAIGNVNDAASFTTQTISTANTANGNSIAVDTSGNTWVAFQKNATNVITLEKHNYGDAWSTWQTAIDDSQTGEYPSLATNSTDVYVIYMAGTGTTGNIVYDKYTGSWLGQTTLQTGAYARPKAKWSYLNNNQGSTQLDYLFDDGTDVYWDKLSLFIAPTKVVFSNGTRNLSYGYCNGDASVFTMQLQDSGGTLRTPSQSTTVQVTSNSTSYTVYSDNTCTTVVSGGNFTFTTSDNTKSVYIKDTGSTGALTLTGTRTSGDTLTTGTQNYTLQAAPAVKIQGGTKIQAGTKIQ